MSALFSSPKTPQVPAPIPPPTIDQASINAEQSARLRQRRSRRRGAAEVAARIMSATWVCTCGRQNWAHHNFCSCGMVKPRANT